MAVEHVADAGILDAGDAVASMRRASICGSDLHRVHGSFPMPAGVILGLALRTIDGVCCGAFRIHAHALRAAARLGARQGHANGRRCPFFASFTEFAVLATSHAPEPSVGELDSLQ